MTMTENTTWIAFAHSKRIASGAPREVASSVKQYADAHPAPNILILDAVTSLPIELDLRGSLSAALKRLPIIPKSEPKPDPDIVTSTERTAGRPKLGVTAREVTLLPRHWEWLAAQPGGASVALRKLVEQARRDSKVADQLRQAQEATYRFMNEMAGDLPGFEESIRALFASDLARLKQLVAKWPRDIRNHVLNLSNAIVVMSDDSISTS